MEPQLGKRGLYPLSSTKESGALVADQMNLLTYCDGTMDLIDIANKINVPAHRLIHIVQQFKEHQPARSIRDEHNNL